MSNEEYNLVSDCPYCGCCAFESAFPLVDAYEIEKEVVNCKECKKKFLFSLRILYETNIKIIAEATDDKE